MLFHAARQHGLLIRIPKSGAAASLVNEAGAIVFAATTLGAEAYWMESSVGAGYFPSFLTAVKRAPLAGGPVSFVAQFVGPGGGSPPSSLAVTSSTVFIDAPPLFDLPSTGDGDLTRLTPVVGAPSCGSVTSDDGAIYCSQQSGSNLRIASDGTSTTLAPAVNSSAIVFDDTYAYWADMAAVGTIMKTPKAGPGTVTVLAGDTSPTAIAIDPSWVYWGDADGNIKRIAK